MFDICKMLTTNGTTSLSLNVYTMCSVFSERKVYFNTKKGCQTNGLCLTQNDSTKYKINENDFTFRHKTMYPLYDNL